MNDYSIHNKHTMEPIEYEYNSGFLYITQHSLEKFFMTKKLTDTQLIFGTTLTYKSDTVYFSKDWCAKNIDTFDNTSLSIFARAISINFSLGIRIYGLDFSETYAYVNICDLKEMMIDGYIFNDIPQTSKYIQYVLYEGYYFFTYTKDAFSYILSGKCDTGNMHHKDMQVITNVMNLMGMRKNIVYIRSCYENGIPKKIAISLEEIPSTVGDVKDTYYNAEDCEYIYDVSCMYGNIKGNVCYINMVDGDPSYQTFLRYIRKKDIDLWANKWNICQ